MKYSPKQNAEILRLDASTVELQGSAESQVEQLRQLFADRLKRKKGERFNGGHREALHIKS